MFARQVSSVARRSLRTASVNYMPSRGIIKLADVKYTATASAKGSGRNGQVESNGLELKLATPKELGGSGQGENPEQLFAMGYASCFLGALQFVAKGQGKQEMAKKAVVHTSVHLGTPESIGGFGIAVDIKVEGIDEELLKAGHEFCPYSRLSTQGAVVKVSLA